MVQEIPSGSAEQTAAKPQFIGTQFSNLCSLLPRPLLMTGVFRDLLIRHFSSRETIETPELQRLIWKQGEQTNILIEAIHRWVPELTEHRPAVIIKRNAYANRRMGIGDRQQMPSADRYGDPHYATFWVGSHTLFCLGGSGAQAELLATEVQRELTEFGPLILRSLGLHRFQITEVGAIAELEEATENFVVPVTAGYAYEQRWRLSQQAPTLRTISLSTILDF
jgi:hypothetical protein